MEENDLQLRTMDALNNLAKATKELCDVANKVIENNNAIIDNLSKLNRFAGDTFVKMNDTTMILDAISVCLFESEIIKQDRFQEVYSQIRKEHEDRMNEQIENKSKECNCGGCDEEEGKGDCSGAKEPEANV